MQKRIAASLCLALAVAAGSARASEDLAKKHAGEKGAEATLAQWILSLK